MIGNRSDAEVALAGMGKYIGSGSARNAYLVNDVVYKIDGQRGANRTEIETLMRLSNVTFPENIALPLWQAFFVDGEYVVAMEYIQGNAFDMCYCELAGVPCECTADDLPENVLRFFTDLDIFDLGAGNVIERDGICYLIDCDY